MRRFLSIAMTVALVATLASSSFADREAGRKALKQLNNIRNGNNTQDQIKKLRVRETAIIGSNVTFGANASITVAKDITFTGSVTVVSNVVGSNGESWDNITDGTIVERWDDTGSTNKGSRVFQSDSVTTNSDDNSTFDIVLYRALNDSSEVIDWATLQPQIADNTTNTEDTTMRLFIQIGGTETLVGTWNAAGFTSAGLLDSAGGFADNGVSGSDFAWSNVNNGVTTIVYSAGGIIVSNVIE